LASAIFGDARIHDSKVISTTAVPSNLDLVSRLQQTIQPGIDIALATIPELIGVMVIPIWKDDVIAPDKAGFIMSNNGPDQRLVLAIKAGEVLAAAMRHHATAMTQIVGEMHQTLKQLSLDAMATLTASPPPDINP